MLQLLDAEGAAVLHSDLEGAWFGFGFGFGFGLGLGLGLGFGLGLDSDLEGAVELEGLDEQCDAPEQQGRSRADVHLQGEAAR